MSQVGKAEVCPEIAVRNLDVIDYLANDCKWCGEVIFNSSTKPRSFCDNNNRCCNNYSRRGVSSKVWEALKSAKNLLVLKDAPSFAPTIVKTITKNERGEDVEVFRVEPMRLFPAEEKQTGVCARPKDEPTNPSELGAVKPPELPFVVKKPTKVEAARIKAERKLNRPAGRVVEHKARYNGLSRHMRGKDQHAFAIKTNKHVSNPTE